jgi:hypothetical protein
MSDFWNNIRRYPSFFVSSLFGSILVILTPFKNLLKNPNIRIFTIGLFLLFFINLYFILKTMVAL